MARSKGKARAPRSAEPPPAAAAAPAEAPPPGGAAPAEVDYLEQDPELRGQRYVCMSFVSPEDVIASRQALAVSSFLASFCREASGMLDGIREHLAEGDAARVAILESLRDRFGYMFDAERAREEFDLFSRDNASAIDAEFARASGGLTAVRGFKVRGSYETVEEAHARAERLRKTDPRFSVYVAQVGCWCPWSPNPDDIRDSEYSESALNHLMKSYLENVEQRDEFFAKRSSAFQRAPGIPDELPQPPVLRPEEGGGGGASGPGADPQ